MTNVVILKPDQTGATDMHAYKPRREESESIIGELAKTYPGCFNAGYKRLPLVESIVDDLVADGFPYNRVQIASAIDWYHSGWGYQDSLEAGAKRINLQGKDCAAVTPSEAREALAQVTAQRAERKRIDEQTERTIADVGFMRERPKLPTPDLFKDLKELFAGIEKLRESVSGPLLKPLLVTALKALVAEAGKVADRMGQEP